MHPGRELAAVTAVSLEEIAFRRDCSRTTSQTAVRPRERVEPKAHRAKRATGGRHRVTVSEDRLASARAEFLITSRNDGYLNEAARLCIV